jgi:hypothetical protein
MQSSVNEDPNLVYALRNKPMKKCPDFGRHRGKMTTKHHKCKEESFSKQYRILKFQNKDSRVQWIFK